MHGRVAGAIGTILLDRAGPHTAFVVGQVVSRVAAAGGLQNRWTEQAAEPFYSTSCATIGMGLCNNPGVGDRD